MIIRKGVVRMTNIRFWISKISIYVFVYCALFLIQRALLLLFFDVKQFILFDKIYAYEIILSIICVIEVIKGIKVTRPE